MFKLNSVFKSIPQTVSCLIISYKLRNKMYLANLSDSLKYLNKNFHLARNYVRYIRSSYMYRIMLFLSAYKTYLFPHMNYDKRTHTH